MTLSIPADFGLTVVVPSFNQADFLDQTIDSIISQNKSWVKIIVIDGGSTDNTLSILSRYSKFLHYYHSRPDNGQVDAIHQGFLIADTPWVSWQNSDDLYIAYSFDHFAAAVNKNSCLDLVFGDLNLIDHKSNYLRTNYFRPLSFNALLYEGMLIANQSAFFKKSAYFRIGGLDPSYDLAFDYDFFLRFSQLAKSCLYIPRPLGSLRLHESTKTTMQFYKFQQEITAVKAKFSHSHFFENFSPAIYKCIRAIIFLFYLPLRAFK